MYILTWISLKELISNFVIYFLNIARYILARVKIKECIIILKIVRDTKICFTTN